MGTEKRYVARHKDSQEYYVHHKSGMLGWDDEYDGPRTYMTKDAQRSRRFTNPAYALLSVSGFLPGIWEVVDITNNKIVMEAQWLPN